MRQETRLIDHPSRLCLCERRSCGASSTQWAWPHRAANISPDFPSVSTQSMSEPLDISSLKTRKWPLFAANINEFLPNVSHILMIGEFDENLEMVFFTNCSCPFTELQCNAVHPSTSTFNMSNCLWIRIVSNKVFISGINSLHTCIRTVFPSLSLWFISVEYLSKSIAHSIWQLQTFHVKAFLPNLVSQHRTSVFGFNNSSGIEKV